MALAVGTRIGTYEISAPIGAGGMGEVYRARDTKLSRDVAIKVLPDDLAADEERVARFEREAQLLASLNHPNIASIYGFEESNGVKALVLELVEGPTLAERIQKGPIPVEEVIAIAKQIVEALEAGHEAGVVHRDLKPANIKLKEDGTVKVLDYGLAKAFAGDAASPTDGDLSQSPTLTRQGTQVGVILGTAAYMSPEQAKGKSVDKRTDIWAFGAVLYEMLTGKKAFDGDEVSDILAAVLRAEPDFGALPKELPSRAREMVRRCLVKPSRSRWRDIGDVRVEIEELLREGAGPEAPTGSLTASRGSMLGYAASAVLAGSIAGLAVWMLRPQPEAPVTRFIIPLAADQTFTNIGRGAVDLSPDGRRVAYIANETIFARAMDELEATPVRGVEGLAIAPVFSPDGAWIAFYDGSSLKKAPVEGGPVVTLCPVANLTGTSWEPDGTIWFGQGADGLWRVSDKGGAPEQLFPTDPEGSTLYYAPRPLPGGGAILYTTSTGDWDQSKVVVRSLDTGLERTLVERGRDARYIESGHLVYSDGENLIAAPFDPDRGTLTGAPVPVVERVASSANTPAVHFAAARSNGGTLAFIPESSVEPMRSLSWRDRAGAVLPIEAPRGHYVSATSAPKGDRIAVVRRSESGTALWLYDVEAQTWTRLTFEGSVGTPQWARDGASIVFTSEDGNLFMIEAAGGTTPVRLTEGLYNQHASAVSPNGKWVVYHEHGPEWGPWLLDVESSEEPVKFAEAGASFFHDFSPDGRWLAYTSGESGQNEIYVEPFPGPGGRFQLSDGGGTAPSWSRQDELIYRNGRNVMSVSVSTTPSFSADAPTVLFEAADINDWLGVTENGDRFFVPERVNESGAQGIVIVLNWREELKRLVPTGN